MEQRYRQQQHVVGADRRRLDRGDLLVVGQQRAVRQHGALRVALGAAGVDQYREVLAAGVRVDRLAGLLRRLGVPVRHRYPDGGEDAGRRDQHRGTRVGQQLVHLTLGVPGVDRDHHETGAQGTEVGDGEVGYVRQRDRHPGRVAGAVRQAEPA